MDKEGQKTLKANLSPIGALAFSIGTALGWGSLVVTGTSYLSQSGIAGSIAGMIIGMAVMFVIARNYAYMMQMHPEAGGAYSFGRDEFGQDYGFLTAWFLSLTYLAVLWANATSIPLFMRIFIGPVLQTGKLYTLFEYDIYAGEVIATIAVLVLTALLCFFSKSATAAVMTVLTAVFVVTILGTSAGSVLGMHNNGMIVWTSPFVPESNELMQIIRIAVISPWAFIGFESISHRTEEFSFDRSKIYNILLAAVTVTSLIYIMLMIMSVTAYPERYDSWLEYIRDRGNLAGLEALPAFYAANHYLGPAGVRLMMSALLALVLTSLIGNTTALSRLFYALGKDGVLPHRFAEIDSHGTPGNAIMLIAAVSCFIPFVGRTAIGWIVDVTNIGAILIYGVVSAAAMRRAKIRGDKIERTTGIAGVVIMVFYALVTLFPALIFEGYIETETFLLFIVWSIIGFMYFRWLLGRDSEKKYGKSPVVWLSLMALVLVITLVWMRQSMIASNNKMTENVNAYYEQFDEGSSKDKDKAYIIAQIDEMNANDRNTIVASIGMLAFALLVLFNNNNFMNRRAQESERMVNTDPLTGVKSKHAYINKCKEMDIEIAEGSSGKFAVAVCDLNGLKHINDTQGHKAGDEYICTASRMICKIFQHSPVFRIGGDEFVVIMRGNDYTARKDLMKNLHEISEMNIPKNGVVVAGGYSDFTAADSNIHDVFERADKQMYEEKMLLKGMGAVTRED